MIIGECRSYFISCLSTKTQLILETFFQMVLVFWYFKTVNWRNKSCISEELKKVWFPFFTGVKHSEKHHKTHLTQNTWRPISCMHSDILSSLPAYFNKTSTGQDKKRTDAKRLPKRPTASLDMPGNAQCMGAGGQKMFFLFSKTCAVGWTIWWCWL